MTAYTITGASATANVATDFTPNGIPVFGDTLTIGASKTLTIPAGYTFDATVTFSGTATGTRASLVNNGTWQVKANPTVAAWLNLTFNAGSVWDILVGKQFLMPVTGTTNAPFKIIANGTEANPVIFTQSDYVSGEPLPAVYQASGGVTQGAMLDLTYTVINNMFSLQCGSGTNAGNHYRLQNVVFDSAGHHATAATSNIADDWIWDKVDIRHTHPSDISNADLMVLNAARNTTGTVTGTKRFTKVTAKTDVETLTKSIRFYTMDHFGDIDYVSDNVKFDTTSANTAIFYKGISYRYSGNEAVSDGNISKWGGGVSGTYFKNNFILMDATDYVRTGSFHVFAGNPNGLRIFENNYCEEIFLQTGIDGSDWYSAPQSAGAVSVKNNIFLFQNGGVFCNSWQGNSVADITIEHNTLVSRTSSFGSNNPYGMYMRTETSPRYTGGTNTLQSNITWVIDTSSSLDGNIAVVHFGGTAALNDQLDVIQYNNHYNVGTTLTYIYRAVTSSTKTLGDPTYGGTDLFLDPQFTGFNLTRKSIIKDYAVSKGVTTSKEAFTFLLRRNGFNETSRRQETSHIVTDNAATIIALAQTAFTPTNVLLSTAAHDGGTIGAVPYVAPASTGGGLTSSGTTSVGLTRSGLTSVGLAA